MKVYISHSLGNSSAALKLADALGKRGFRTWLYVRDLPVGVEWKSEVDRVLKASDAWLFLIGPGPSDREQQFEFQDLAEMEVDLDPSRAIIPVVIGSPDVPSFLTIRQYITVDQNSIDIGCAAWRCRIDWASFLWLLMTDSLPQLEAQRSDLFRELASLGDFRRGSITPTSGKCGKSSCHCAKRGDPGHGPNFRLTRRIKGKTQTETFNSTAALRKAQQEVAEFHRFQKLCADVVEVSEKICTLRPVEETLTPQEKKRPRRSSTKSRAK